MEPKTIIRLMEGERRILTFAATAFPRQGERVSLKLEQESHEYIVVGVVHHLDWMRLAVEQIVDVFVAEWGAGSLVEQTARSVSEHVQEQRSAGGHARSGAAPRGRTDAGAPGSPSASPPREMGLERLPPEAPS